MLTRGFLENFQAPGLGGVLLGGVTTFFVGVLSRSVGLMLLLAVAAIGIDFLAGVYFAFRRRDVTTGEHVFSTEKLYDGAWKKLGRSFLVFVGALWDAMAYVLFDFTGQVGAAQMWEGILPWTMLACVWIVVGETSSTLKTVAKYGGQGAVPAPFRRMTKRLTAWIEKETTDL